MLTLQICFLLKSSKYWFNEVDKQTDVGEVYYVGGEDQQNIVESVDRTRLGSVSGFHVCAVCGNPSTKKCSRCKAIKYCSQTCQHLDWRSGHKFECVAEKANSNQAATVDQERLAHGNVVMSTNSCGEEDDALSSDPLCLEYYSEGNTKSLTLSLQEATNTYHDQKEIEEVRILKEELAKTKNENMSLLAERDNWEMQARQAVDRLYNLRKQNEHQLLILKHENELISNAEKQAREMVHSLSQSLYYLQIEVETGAAERNKQEEYICMLQKECAEAKTELQEQKKCVRRLSGGLDEASQYPVRTTEETRQKLINVFSSVSAAEVFQPISLSTNPSYAREGCTICLTNEKDMAFGCGHTICRDCGSKISKCHICRKKITNRIRLFPG